MRKVLWVRIFGWICNREKSLRCVAMVAKFLDDDKPKTLPKKRKLALFQTLSIILNFIWFVELLAKFGWLNPKGPYRCLEKGKGNFCVHLLHKWVREIRNIETTAKKVQKSVMHVQSFCFANIYLLRLNRSRCRRRRCCWSSILLWSRNFTTMVTWRHNSPLYYVV